MRSLHILLRSVQDLHNKSMKTNYPLSIIYILTILAMFFWSIAFIWVRQAYDLGLQPLTVVFLRLVVASVVLTIVTKLLKINETIDKSDYKFIFFLAFSEPFCYFLGESFGMLFVTPTLAALIVSTIPLIAPIFAWLFLKEKVGIYEIIGLLVSFLGVLILVIDDLNLGGKLIGILLMLIAVIGGTSYMIILKVLADKYPALTITKYQTYIGMLLFMPLFFIFDFKGFFAMGSNSISSLRYIFLLGALPSSFSFTFLAVAVRKLGVTKTNIFTNLIPVFVGLLSFFILKEPFTTAKIIAIAVVITGLFISQWEKIKTAMRSRY